MPIDAQTPGTPGFLLERLARDLREPRRQRRLEMLDAWFRGEPPLPEAYRNAREAVRAFHSHTRSNFAGLISEAPRERLRAEGIRTSSDGDATGDVEAWRIYRRARMALAMAEVHRLVFRFGVGFVLVSPVDPLTGVPVVTAEDPRWVVSEQDPLQPWRTVAALKMFRDTAGSRDYAYLFTPGRLDVAYADLKVPKPGDPGRFSSASWSWDEDLSRDLPSGLMPLIRFSNIDEVAEFEPHLDLLARINYMVLQRMTIATLQAFKQRAVKGVPARDDKGNPIDYNDIFTADPGAIWALPESAEMWESGAVQLDGILASVRADIQALAAVSRTPLSMFAPEGENQSAEGAASAKEGLIFKCEDRIDRLSPCWSAALQACFLLLADAADSDADREAALRRADLNGIDIIWAPAQRASLSERGSALAQAAAAGVPFRSRMIEFGGFSPERVTEMETERVEDLVFTQQQAMIKTRAAAAVTPEPTTPEPTAPAAETADADA